MLRPVQAAFKGPLVPPTVHTTYTQWLFWAASIWSWAFLLSCPKHRQAAALQRWELAHRISQKEIQLCASDLWIGCTVCELPMGQRLSLGMKTSVEAISEIPDPEAKRWDSADEALCLYQLCKWNMEERCKPAGLMQAVWPSRWTMGRKRRTWGTQPALRRCGCGSIRDKGK